MVTQSNSRSALSRTSHLWAVVLALFLAGGTLGAQTPSAEPLGDITGMYTFLREGEFVQITLDEVPATDKKKVPVTGFISLLCHSESDKDQVLDLWIKAGTLDGEHITFTTKPIHGLSYDFDGTVHRGDAKSKAKEGWFVVEGTLIEHSIDSRGRPRTQRRELTMKSFPSLDDDHEH